MTADMAPDVKKLIHERPKDVALLVASISVIMFQVKESLNVIDHAAIPPHLKFIAFSLLVSQLVGLTGGLAFGLFKDPSR